MNSRALLSCRVVLSFRQDPLLYSTRRRSKKDAVKHSGKRKKDNICNRTRNDQALKYSALPASGAFDKGN